jgi:hypothetical protein
MDHIPLPDGATAPRVPFSGKDYDKGDFASYPARQGLSHDLHKLDFSSRRPEEYQAFFQTWLYFGCLVEVFKIIDLDVDTKIFRKPTSELKSHPLHCTFISTS